MIFSKFKRNLDFYQVWQALDNYKLFEHIWRYCYNVSNHLPGTIALNSQTYVIPSSTLDKKEQEWRRTKTLCKENFLLKKITQTQLKIRCWTDFYHGLRTHDNHISNFLHLKSISQSHIKNLVNCKKQCICKITHLTLGICCDKIWADSTTQNTLKYHTIYSVNLQSAKIFGIFEKTIFIGCP